MLYVGPLWKYYFLFGLHIKIIDFEKQYSIDRNWKHTCWIDLLLNTGLFDKFIKTQDAISGFCHFVINNIYNLIS